MLVFLFVLIFAALWLVCPRLRHPEKLQKLGSCRYAHRGLHDAARGVPENSLKAFRLAAEKGYGAELDIHLSADGRLVVMHDDSLLRTCGVEGRVEDMTAEELAALRLEGTEEPVPLLEEVLPIFCGVSPLIVELKVVDRNWAALAEAACKTLDNYEGDYCVESFDPRAVGWLKKNRPAVVRGQLATNNHRHDPEFSPLLGFALRNLCLNFISRPDFIAYDVRDRGSVARRLCTGVLGAQEFSWTIREPETMWAVESEGAAPIFEHFEP